MLVEMQKKNVPKRRVSWWSKVSEEIGGGGIKNIELTWTEIESYPLIQKESNKMRVDVRGMDMSWVVSQKYTPDHPGVERAPNPI